MELVTAQTADIEGETDSLWQGNRTVHANTGDDVGLSLCCFDNQKRKKNETNEQILDASFENDPPAPGTPTQHSSRASIYTTTHHQLAQQLLDGPIELPCTSSNTAGAGAGGVGQDGGTDSGRNAAQGSAMMQCGCMEGCSPGSPAGADELLPLVVWTIVKVGRGASRGATCVQALVGRVVLI
jgi:hypothetical protein